MEVNDCDPAVWEVLAGICVGPSLPPPIVGTSEVRLAGRHGEGVGVSQAVLLGIVAVEHRGSSPSPARCFFIAQSYVLVKKWSEALVLYDRVLKYADEVTAGAGAFRNSLKVSRLSVLISKPGEVPGG